MAKQAAMNSDKPLRYINALQGELATGASGSRDVQIAAAATSDAVAAAAVAAAAVVACHGMAYRGKRQRGGVGA